MYKAKKQQRKRGLGAPPGSASLQKPAAPQQQQPVVQQPIQKARAAAPPQQAAPVQDIGSLLDMGGPTQQAPQQQ